MRRSSEADVRGRDLSGGSRRTFGGRVASDQAWRGNGDVSLSSSEIVRERIRLQPSSMIITTIVLVGFGSGASIRRRDLRRFPI